MYYDDNIFPFFHEFKHVFRRELQVLSQIMDVTKTVKHVETHQ